MVAIGIAAYIEEDGKENADPAGWPLMGLHTSESGGVRAQQ